MQSAWAKVSRAVSTALRVNHLLPTLRRALHLTDEAQGEIVDADL
jgi:hypothetical protein